MSVKDIRQAFEHQLKVSEEIMRREYALLHPVPEVRESEKLEGRPMAAPNAIRGLAGKLREHLARATARAEALAGDVEKSVSNLHARMDDADKMKREIDTAANEIHQVVGMDNGGPEVK